MRHCYKLSSVSVLVSVAVVLFALGAPPANAQAQKVGAVTRTAAIVPSQTAKRVLKRNAAQNSAKRFFIEFRARSAASYGHMYVLYGQVNAHDEIIMSDIAGLHPAGDANNCENCSVVSWTLGHVFFVRSETGASDGDLEEKYVTSRYRVMLDAAEYKRVSAYINKLKADSPEWNALWRNCVSFGRDIASFMGLKTPTFIWLEPKDFVDDLRELNGGQKQEPLKDAPPPQKSASRLPPHSVASATLPQPRKPNRQPMANLPPAETGGAAPATSR